MKTRLIVAALSVLAGATREAQAQTSTDEGGIDERRIRATVSTGFAVALADYETHGIAFPIRAGADLPLLRTGPVRHHLLLAAEYAHFSRSFITEPEVLPGVQLDVGSLRGTWRLFPFQKRGLHFEAGAGIAVLRDRIRVELPNRSVSSSVTRLGLPLEVGLGWTVGHHVDLGLRYSHVVPVRDDTSSVLGQLELALGVRL